MAEQGVDAHVTEGMFALITLLEVGADGAEGAVDHEVEVAVGEGKGEALVAEVEDDGFGDGAGGFGGGAGGGRGCGHQLLEVEREELLG